MISVATWNINSVRLRMPLVAQFLTEEAPDVLCLQEIKCQEHQFPAQAFADLGYVHQAVHGQKGYHGVATVSRVPLKEVSRHDWQDNGEARHVGVELLGAGKGLVIENVYIPAGGDLPDREANPKFGQKLDFVERMTRWAETIDRPSLLVGDFNVAPLECDVYDHKALLKVVSHTPIEVERLACCRMRTAGSIWAASISPRPSAIIRGGPIAPTGRARIAGGDSITCGPPRSGCAEPRRTGLSSTPATGNSRATTCRW